MGGSKIMKNSIQKICCMNDITNQKMNKILTSTLLTISKPGKIRVTPKTFRAMAFNLENIFFGHRAFFCAKESIF